MPGDLTAVSQGSQGHAQRDHETTSNTAQEATKPINTCRPRSDRQNRYRSKGMNRNLINEPMPSKRSAHDTSAHNIPRPPSITNNTGSAPAGINSTRRNDCTSSVGMHASNHNPAIMAVAEVDHGSDTASATARQSANTTKRFSSKVVAFNGQLLETEQHVSPVR